MKRKKADLERLEDKALLNEAEAARFLDMDRELLTYYVNAGRGPKHKEVAGKRVYQKKALMGWKPVLLKTGRKPKEKPEELPRM